MRILISSPTFKLVVDVPVLVLVITFANDDPFQRCNATVPVLPPALFALNVNVTVDGNVCDGVTLGVAVIEIDGVVLIDGVKLIEGVILIDGVKLTPGVTLLVGVILILGVTEIVGVIEMLGVAVILGVIEILGVMLILGVILIDGVTEIVGVGDGDVHEPMLLIPAVLSITR